MGLNKSKGNMYPWVQFTWNPIKGKCPHDCSYCYMKRWGSQNEVHFDKKELKEFDRDMQKYGENKTIFVGSSCDMWADGIPPEWVIWTLEHLSFYDNTYLFQTKNPKAFDDYGAIIAGLEKIILCTTIETNRWYASMGNAPSPKGRSHWLSKIWLSADKYVTIEPVMDFDRFRMIELIENIRPKQINIGADSQRNYLPEPHPDKLRRFIDDLHDLTCDDLKVAVILKDNLKRIMKF